MLSRIDVISANRSIFDSDSWEVKSCKEAAEKMIQAVEASIDPIEIHKDGLAWTFAGSIRASQEHYFGGIDKCKFKGKVVPGDKLRLETRIIRKKGPIGVGEAVATVDGKKVVSAVLTFAVG